MAVGPGGQTAAQNSKLTLGFNSLELLVLRKAAGAKRLRGAGPEKSGALPDAAPAGKKAKSKKAAKAATTVASPLQQSKLELSAIIAQTLTGASSIHMLLPPRSSCHDCSSGRNGCSHHNLFEIRLPVRDVELYVYLTWIGNKMIVGFQMTYLSVLAHLSNHLRPQTETASCVVLAHCLLCINPRHLLITARTRMHLREWPGLRSDQCCILLPYWRAQRRPSSWPI